MCEGQVTRTERPRHRPREAEAGAWLWNSQTHRDREGLSFNSSCVSAEQMLRVWGVCQEGGEGGEGTGELSSNA